MEPTRFGLAAMTSGLVDTALNYRLPKRYGFITVGATNLFDKKFKFFNTDFDNPFIQPDRMFFARVTLALPLVRISNDEEALEKEIDDDNKITSKILTPWA